MHTTKKPASARDSRPLRSTAHHPEGAARATALTVRTGLQAGVRRGFVLDLEGEMAGHL